MGRVTSTIEQLADRIVAYETQHALTPLTHIAVTTRICEKLRLHLTPLIGSTSYHALITRTLAILEKDNPWTEGIRIRQNGSLELAPIPESHAQANPQAREAMAIPSQLLSLLATFIGEPLTLTLALEIWPPLQAKTPITTRQVK